MRSIDLPGGTPLLGADPTSTIGLDDAAIVGR
jgi:hypothetical protein